MTPIIHNSYPDTKYIAIVYTKQYRAQMTCSSSTHVTIKERHACTAMQLVDRSETQSCRPAMHAGELMMFVATHDCMLQQHFAK